MNLITDNVIGERVQPTNNFRFKEKRGRQILQQMWWIIMLTENTKKERGEWRDVQSVGPNASDTEAL